MKVMSQIISNQLYEEGKIIVVMRIMFPESSYLLKDNFFLRHRSDAMVEKIFVNMCRCAHAHAAPPKVKIQTKAKFKNISICTQ